MDSADVRCPIFSSSATVYGDPDTAHVDVHVHVYVPETAPTGQPATSYGISKLMIEQILRDLAAADPRWSVGLSRYFNPLEAHPSGDIAECYADPTRAQQELGWRAEYDLEAMMRDAWHWQRKNPRGFRE